MIAIQKVKTHGRHSISIPIKVHSSHILELIAFVLTNQILELSAIDFIILCHNTIPAKKPSCIHIHAATGVDRAQKSYAIRQQRRGVFEIMLILKTHVWQ